jgi:beta-barrel assembly-enhancing protease
MNGCTNVKVMFFTLSWLAVCHQAHAQLGGILDKGLKKAQQADEAKKKLDALMVTDEEERRIGEAVSARVRQRFGVVQSEDVHKYVTLVGTLVAQQSERPQLRWAFIVLDTDGVNAFASPGGLIHITRGALGLISNEAELAGVLAHEIGHVAHKHTVNALRKNKAVQYGTNETLSDRSLLLDRLANKAYEMVLENAFDRGDELDADKQSVQLSQKVGYAPASLAGFLARLDERNKDQPAANGLFASHPETRERIDKIRQLAGAATGATVEVRYKSNIRYEPTPITAIAAVEDGAAGLTGSTNAAATEKDKGKKDTDKDKDTDTDKDGKDADQTPKKKGFGLGNLKQTVAPENKSTQVSASGGARGVGPDRAAKGGSNPNLVSVAVTDAEVAAFKKGVA